MADAPGAFVMKMPTTNITAINGVTSFQCFEKIGNGDIVFGLNNGYATFIPRWIAVFFVRIRARMLGPVSIECEAVPGKLAANRY